MKLLQIISLVMGRVDHRYPRHVSLIPFMICFYLVSRFFNSCGRLYHFIVRILTIDYDRSFIPDYKQPIYDGWLSVGSTKKTNQDVSMSGDGGSKQVPIQIISYYEDIIIIKDFNFDTSHKQMQFTMPFDWNVTRLEKENQVLVHQEVSVPKQSELATKSYLGTVNGIDVTKNLMFCGRMDRHTLPSCSLLK